MPGQLFAKTAKLIVDTLLSVPANRVKEAAETFSMELASFAHGAALLSLTRVLTLRAFLALGLAVLVAESASLASFTLGEAGFAVTVMASSARVTLAHAGQGLGGTVSTRDALGFALREVARLAGVTKSGTFVTALASFAHLAVVGSTRGRIGGIPTSRTFNASGHAHFLSV